MRPSVVATICGTSSLVLFVFAGGWAAWWIRWAVQDASEWESMAGFIIALLGSGTATLFGAGVGAIGVVMKAPKGWIKTLALAGLILNGAVAIPLSPFFLQWFFSILDF